MIFAVFLSEARPERYQQLEARYYPIMIDIPGGTFEMGCNDEIDTDCRYDEMPHPVKLSAYRWPNTRSPIGNIIYIVWPVARIVLNEPVNPGLYKATYR
jgi:hypothetical protein